MSKVHDASTLQATTLDEEALDPEAAENGSDLKTEATDSFKVFQQISQQDAYHLSGNSQITRPWKIC